MSTLDLVALISQFIFLFVWLVEQLFETFALYLRIYFYYDDYEDYTAACSKEEDPWQIFEQNFFFPFLFMSVKVFAILLFEGSRTARPMKLEEKDSHLTLLTLKIVKMIN